MLPQHKAEPSGGKKTVEKIIHVHKWRNLVFPIEKGECDISGWNRRQRSARASTFGNAEDLQGGEDNGAEGSP